jgi:GDP-L-fucose synthase
MFENKNILITGGTGMIGSHLVELLADKANVRLISHKRKVPKEIDSKKIEIINGDLTNKEFAIKAVKNMDYVFHLAAYTGGLGRTTVYPASTLTPNLILDGNVIDAAKNENVEKFLYASCSCVYPDLEKDFSEEDAWIANPPQMHASYSWSKRMGELQAISYSKEYGMKIAIVRPANSYGPREVIDPQNSHVIGALILKSLTKKNPFLIWGDGSPIREYIFAKDAALGMILAIEKYCKADPINLSSGETVTIHELAQKILKICDYSPSIIFDKSKPGGQSRRVLTNHKAEKILGFKARTPLNEGLKATINWIKNNMEIIN